MYWWILTLMDTINCGSCIDNLWTHCIFLNGKQNTFKELKKKKTTTRTHSLPDDKYTLYGNFTENHQFMVEDEIQGQNPSISLIKRKLHFASHCNVFQTRHKMTPPIIVFFQMTMIHTLCMRCSITHLLSLKCW